MKEEIYYYLAFSYFLGIGPVRFTSLLKKFGNAKKAYQASKEELVEVIGNNLAQKFILFREKFDSEEKMKDLRKKEIVVVPLYSDLYPVTLKNIADPPICLYLRGNVNILSNYSPLLFEEKQHDFSATSPLFFAIVGTRKPTTYGEQIAKKFSQELASAGFIIVSGMAMGIDAIAHWGCLEVGGKTVAVLGCGVDVIYPAINRVLYEKIVNGGGVVVSEFPPGHKVAKGLFIARNRIISGLSAGVLVVEGLKDSGALITARYAAEQGKEVFAPPAPLTSQMSQAPNLLLKQGAKLVTSVADIYEELGVKVLPKKKEEMKIQLSDKEKIIFEVLAKEPMIVDQLALTVKKPISEVLNTISLLEIKGVVEKNQEGKYQIKI